MNDSGIEFVLVQAWGGLGENTYAPQQFQEAQQNSPPLGTAAYAIVNYRTDSQDGVAQIDKAFEPVGTNALQALKFMVVDVEPCCGEYKYWEKDFPYNKGFRLPTTRKSTFRR